MKDGEGTSRKGGYAEREVGGLWTKCVTPYSADDDGDDNLVREYEDEEMLQVALHSSTLRCQLPAYFSQ